MMESSKTATAVVELCEGRISPTEAATLFAQPLEKSPNPGDLLENAWDKIHDAMVSTYDGQPRLIEMLIALKKRPDVDMSSKEKRGPLSDEAKQTLWADLPAYNWTFSDLVWWYHQNDWRKNGADYANEAKRAEIVNIAAAEARLTASGVQDFGIECYERLSDTLEDEHGSLDIELPAVCATLVNAGAVLHSRLGKDDEQVRIESNSEIRKAIGEGKKHSSLAESRKLYAGKGGVSEDRWKFWTDRLHALQSDDSLTTEAQISAREGWEAMKHL